MPHFAEVAEVPSGPGPQVENHFSRSYRYLIHLSLYLCFFYVGSSNNLKKSLFVTNINLFLTNYMCVRTESDRCTESDSVVLECVCVCVCTDRCLHGSVFIYFFFK